MSATIKDRLGPEAFNAVRAAEGEAFAESERERLKTKYVELDLEMRAAIETRVEEVERELSPTAASADDLLRASSATPEQLIDMMDLALDAGLEDAALLAFAAGQQRDLDDGVGHAIDVHEDWAELYAEIAMAANDPDLDPGERVGSRLAFSSSSFCESSFGPACPC